MTSSVYADTSALVKTVHQEEETSDLLDLLRSLPARLVSSELTITELHRTLAWLGLPPATASRRLRQISLVPLTRVHLLSAGLLPDPSSPARTRLSSADAIHLAAALQAEASALLTYDRNQSRAAASLGMSLLHPGREPGWYS